MLKKVYAHFICLVILFLANVSSGSIHSIGFDQAGSSVQPSFAGILRWTTGHFGCILPMPSAPWQIVVIRPSRSLLGDLRLTFWYLPLTSAYCLVWACFGGFVLSITISMWAPMRPLKMWIESPLKRTTWLKTITWSTWQLCQLQTRVWLIPYAFLRYKKRPRRAPPCLAFFIIYSCGSAESACLYLFV